MELKKEYLRLMDEYIAMLKTKEEYKDIEDWAIGRAFFPGDWHLSDNYELKIKLLKLACEVKKNLVDIKEADVFYERTIHR